MNLRKRGEKRRRCGIIRRRQRRRLDLLPGFCSNKVCNVVVPYLVNGDMILSNLFLDARMEVPALELETNSGYDSIHHITVITSAISLEAPGFRSTENDQGHL